jgi:hypothetical protein
MPTAWTALVADAFGDLVSAELAEVAALISAVDDPAARIGVLLETLLDGSRTDITLVWVQAWARRPRRDARRPCARGDGRLAAVLAAEVERGMDAGVFAVGDPDAIAWHLLAIIDGLNAHSLVRWDGQPDRRGLVQRAVAGLLGVAPRSCAGASRTRSALPRPLDRHRPAEHVLGGAVARAQRGGDGRGIIRPRGLAGEVQHAADGCRERVVVGRVRPDRHVGVRPRPAHGSFLQSVRTMPTGSGMSAPYRRRSCTMTDAVTSASVQSRVAVAAGPAANVSRVGCRPAR